MVSSGTTTASQSVIGAHTDGVVCLGRSLMI